MNNPDEVFNSHLMEVVRNFPGDNKKKPGSEDAVLQGLLKLLLFLGADAIFAIFRKNLGRKAINPFRLVIAFLCFVLISAQFFSKFYNDDIIDDENGSPASYLITAALLMLLAITFLVKGISHIRKAKSNSYYTGESALLAFLAKDGWQQQTIQLVAEPVCVIAIGGAYSFYNLWGGLVIAFCGVSVWGRTLIDQFYLGNRVQSTLNSQSANNENNTDHVS